ncbi:MAG: DUF3024 domain-containing protein [Steroidobacteraceae bacterium]|nr:DUF3024 domain-containing protein [Steroidobacteraceae bacterium]MDW8258931.1 DUF3024 domain-containing protein [Gammaproteobacteria bacterium]
MSAACVNEIPQHSRRLAERLLAAYCQRICPPTARGTVRLAFTLELDRITIHELRPICGVPGTQRPVPLAQFRYRHAEARWRLYYAERQGLWRPYPAEPRTRPFLEWLRELDADPQGRFFARIDGKSLRWCRAEGRCRDCDARYCRVLGLQTG